jgi:dTDP-4-amino-4,6-dideoxygalactose transaminase
MLTTSDPALAEHLRLLRGHGMEPRYYHQAVGINSRLDSIQAAVLNVKLDHLSAWTRQRQANARRYHELFAAAGLDQSIGLPTVSPKCEHVWNQYTIRIPDQQRDRLRQYLSEANIGTEIYYPVPIHRQECFSALGYGPGSLPETERAAREVLSLPIFPQLTLQEQESVVRGIAQYFRRQYAGQRKPLVPARTAPNPASAQPSAGM